MLKLGGPSMEQDGPEQYQVTVPDVIVNLPAAPREEPWYEFVYNKLAEQNLEVVGLAGVIAIGFIILFFKRKWLISLVVGILTKTLKGEK